MFKVENNRIYLTKGDTATITINITQDNKQPYALEESDNLRLTVKRNISDSAPVFTVTADNAGAFHIAHSDTASLSTGEYVYDVQLRRSNGDINTVVPPSRFIIGEVVSDGEY